ncbi:hypothetical protein K4K49_001105 [Colletotrichum sp. SAR 10_70]|nr:hypothetical protein K4K50_003464 [Colletotrichum sp. SAR 10_71]KAI8182041.1 hypothetical protein K4K49_001105 [Colletotrichum sp. SAR 10_70]KAI8198420.1 hypothetical protein K4K52_009788 [Colletotrichum sp. SAR 10_76]KAI8216544.1 hypothetical protein K4K53_009971 [Colletotrichum sp. SAR 10_77]
MAEVAFPSPGLFQSEHGGTGLESPTSKGYWDAPSDRTAPGTVSTVRITIAEPEVPDRFGYPEDHSYRDYVYTTDRLGIDDFQKVMDEISTQYMGIRRGKGKGMKNFATQVLRIELSGPSRSHFSILDVPGLISNAHAVNKYEMEAVNKMIDDYMRQPANIVICVADAVTDLARQEIFMKTAVVEKKRLVGVFTKCDMLHDASEIVDIANGTGEYADKSMQDGWFVVRNRSAKDGDDFNLQEAESQLFDQPPWNNIDPSRRGSQMLKKHLGNLLCARIRDNFPTIRDTISRLLSEAEGSRQTLGDPRPTHNLRQQYLRDVLQRYGEIADKALYYPGFLDDEMMRVRAMTRSANEEFTQAMKDRGHAYNFQDADVDPVKQLTDIMSHHYSSQSQASLSTEQPVTPPSTPPKKGRERQSHNIQEQSATSFTQEVRSQLKIWQTTELPGLVNTEVIKVLFMKQSEKWEHIAEEHIDRVGRHVEDAADKILRAVCSPSDGCEIIQKELSAVIGQFQRQAKEKALSELKEHCRRERQSHLQTTDIRFQQNLQALRSSRLLNTLGSMPVREGTLVEPAAHLHALFRHIHHSAEDNMINDVHDVVKVYYQISLCNFIEHVTSNITENFISHETGPLRGLSTKWMFTLTEEEVQKLAREDEHIVQQRTELEGIIEKLRNADDIVETARNQTSGLGDI